MQKDKEQKIVELAKTDATAFGELFDHYYPKIFNYVFRRTADFESAQDITAETFIKSLDKIKTFEWRGIPFSAWLYRIASNEIANHFRDKHSKNSSLEALLEEQGFEPIDETDIQAELEAAEEEVSRHVKFLQVQKQILKLPIKYQEVLSLRYFENKTIDEISQITNKKPGTVKSLLSRGIKKLRESATN
ncbi:MAG TPA: RNA polymerase sigma factor [Candidatus Saccharimonadales bacterium]|nr:RNA polymerase sigma factor [Candidatus Saccharimonadales bacterium]